MGRQEDNTAVVQNSNILIFSWNKYIFKRDAKMCTKSTTKTFAPNKKKEFEMLSRDWCSVCYKWVPLNPNMDDPNSPSIRSSNAKMCTKRASDRQNTFTLNINFSNWNVRTSCSSVCFLLSLKLSFSARDMAGHEDSTAAGGSPWLSYLVLYQMSRLCNLNWALVTFLKLYTPAWCKKFYAGVDPGRWTGYNKGGYQGQGLLNWTFVRLLKLYM